MVTCQVLSTPLFKICLILAEDCAFQSVSPPHPRFKGQCCSNLLVHLLALVPIASIHPVFNIINRLSYCNTLFSSDSMIPVQKTKNKTKQKTPPKLLLVSHRKSAKLLHLAFKVFFNLTQISLFLLPYMDPISRKVISLISSSFTSAYIALPSSCAVFKSYSVSQGHNSSLTSGRIPPCPFLPILTGSFSELRGSGGCWNCQRPEQLLSPLVLSADHAVYTLSTVSSARLGAISRFPIPATVPGTQCGAQ